MPNPLTLAELTDDISLITPPPVAMRVVEKTSQPHCSLEEISALISLDPVLCGKVLKTVNSALYSLPYTVTSMNRALSLLGLKAVRSLLLSLTLPSVLKKQWSDDFLRSHWRSSVAGAVAARELALHLRRRDPEDDMVAALLRDLGVLILQKARPDEYAQLLAGSPPLVGKTLCWKEREVLGLSHPEVAEHILTQWRLPRELVLPIRFHHDPEAARSEGPAIVERAHLLNFADGVAELLLCRAQAAQLRELAARSRALFNLEEETLVAMFTPMQEKFREMAKLLDIHIGGLEASSETVTEAVMELARLNATTTVDHALLSEQKAQAEMETQRWRRIARRLRREAECDRLTGVYNRSYFDDALAVAFKKARRCGTLLGLLFIDLDDFKRLNDNHGHTAGDQALRKTARTLLRSVRQSDTVARYGGDEFVVLILDTTPSGLQTLAQRLWQNVNELRIESDTPGDTLKASVGGAVCFPANREITCEGLLAAADKAMYTAKKAGKNAVVIECLHSEREQHMLDQVRSRQFSQYLLARGALSRATLQEAINKCEPSSTLVGRIARRHGWLSSRKLRRILDHQRLTRKPFAEAALSLGLLTPARAYCLLAIQRENPERLAEQLVKLAALSPGEAQRLLADYYREIQKPEMNIRFRSEPELAEAH